MFSEDMDQAVKRYEKRLGELGQNPQALGWRSRRQQFVRFEVLSEIGTLDNCSILDLGCGFGDLFDYLSQRGIIFDYTGYDISHRLISIAKERHPNVNFQVKDILTETVGRKFDYVISSGIFNHKISNNILFLQEIFKKSLELSNKGIAHNMLSNYVDFKNEALYYSDPSDIFSFCKTLSKRVTLRHDYMPFEFTMYVYKQDAKDSENIFGNF